MRFFGALACLAAAVNANGIHDANGKIIEGLAPEELAVGMPGSLSDTTPSIPLYRDSGKTESPPYTLPIDRVYNTTAGPVEGKINVHLTPHTHDDTGWQVTVDQYFFNEVYYVVDTVVSELQKNPDRKFMYVEVGFFARWWEATTPVKQAQCKTLVENGQLEFINGAWCMHDEASPHWNAMVDQTVRGHQFLLKNFGKKANPRGTWQIDPFGHSNTEAWLLGAEAGMESLFWGRTDYQDLHKRYNESGYEWIWQGSQSMGDSSQVFAGALYGTGNGGYSTWMSFDGNGDQINDDPARHDYNVDQWVDKFVQDATKQDAHIKTSHQLWACGTDFQYQNADHWYTNLDKLIHYVNLNGTVNAFYSTPSLYVDQKKLDKTVKWEVRQDDIFPLADNAHHYWTGYFTSRPALKRQVRFGTNFLQSARQMEILSGVDAKAVGKPTQKFSPKVGTSWTDSLEGAIGVATHHDGMSGTERQDVSDDYELRISESQVEAEAGVAMSLSKLLGLPTSPPMLEHCNCNAANDCLNISVCAVTTDNSEFSVVAWNPMGQNRTDIVRVPVASGTWSVSDSAGNAIVSQVTLLDDRTKSLPKLYLNKFKMKDAEVKKAEAALANKAGATLIFSVQVPAVGYSVYTAKKAATTPTVNTVADHSASTADQTVSNDVYDLVFDGSTGMLKTVTNKLTSVTTPLQVDWGWYNSSVGGCTDLSGVDPKIREKECDNQKSGAYMFRPNSSKVFYPGPTTKPTLKVVTGPVVTEVYQIFSEWATHVIRLYHKDPIYKGLIEVEWTAGPIPVDTPWFPPVAHDKKTKKALPNIWGKEVILRYSSGIKSEGTFYTDSNGKEMVKRVYNKRGPSYPMPYNISEPVAGNYYPVNAMITLDDGKHSMAVLTDVSMGGASLKDGQLELMLHRRVQMDDSRGVQEPLNETMCGCNDIGAKPGAMGAHGHEGDGGCDCKGLTMRGRHFLMVDTLKNVNDQRRILSEIINYPPTLAFAPKAIKGADFSGLAQEFPHNVKLVTLTNNYASFNNGSYMLRLAHMFGTGESDLAAPVTFSLASIFAKSGLKIKSIFETSLTGNQPIAEMDAKKFKWNTEPGNAMVAEQINSCKSFEKRVPFDPTSKDLSLTLRPMEVRTFLANFE